jgi:ABC-2 type transport system ATP-binding protein
MTRHGGAIDVVGLRKAYGDKEAVAGVDFTVGDGEVFALLGPNGAGKTTIAEILEGFRARSAGEVRVLGHDPGAGERALRERIGIVLQECGVQPDLTVDELLSMYGRPYPRRRPMDELIALVELDAKRHARVRELSGGQRRRLDLALALVGDPDLIFLDEPTTGFDPSARRQAWATLRALRSLGRTIFLTTHFMDEAQALADRIAVMREGRIVATGTPAQLGGRDTAPTHLEFALDDPADAAHIPLAGEETLAVADGGGIRVCAPDGVAAAARITTWAVEQQIALRGFSVTQPTLEDVYLQLTAAAEEARS